MITYKGDLYMIQESKKNGVARAEGQMDLRCITCFIAILFYADRASVSSKSSFNFTNIQDVISPSLNYDRAKFFSLALFVVVSVYAIWSIIYLL